MKKQILFFALFLCVSFYSLAQIPTDSLLLYYRFSNGAIDESNNALHGTIYGATPTTDRFGNPNRAYFFDGVDDYIEMPNNQILKPDLPLSISFWVKLESLEQIDNMFLSTSPDVDNNAGCFYSLNSAGTGALNVNFGDNSGVNNSSSRRSKTTYMNLSVGIWTHVVTVFKGATDMDIYINGVLVDGFYTGSGGNIGYTANAGTIGRAIPSGSFYYWGSLDDFAYYNKALDSAEVVSLYAENECLEIIYDTITVTDTLITYVFDTVQVLDTIITQIYDTITTEVFDTTIINEIIYDTTLLSVNDTLIIYLYTSINPIPTDSPDNSILVYPNPANSILFIDLEATDQYTYSVVLRNSLGQIIFGDYSFTNNIQLDISTYTAGLYYIDVTNNDTGYTTTRKIVFE